MNGRHLLDTNIIVALFKNDENVRTQIVASSEVFVPAIAIGELYYGAQHSARVEKNMKQVREFAANSTVLSNHTLLAAAPLPPTLNQTTC